MSATAVEQLGLAMMPWCERSASALISGTTSGTLASMRKAELLSITRQPRLTASGARAFDTDPPAAKNARLSPTKASGVASCTVSFFPPKSMLRPAERAEARGLSSASGKACACNRAISS